MAERSFSCPPAARHDASKALDVGLQWKSIFNIASDTSLTLGSVAQAIQATSGTNILSTANLQKIPYVGALFRNLSRTRKRTNLLVFLRPVIMRDEATASASTLDRNDYIRANQQAVQQTAPETLPGAAGVTLPADPKAPFRPE